MRRLWKKRELRATILKDIRKGNLIYLRPTKPVTRIIDGTEHGASTVILSTISPILDAIYDIFTIFDVPAGTRIVQHGVDVNDDFILFSSSSFSNIKEDILEGCNVIGNVLLVDGLLNDSCLVIIFPTDCT